VQQIRVCIRKEVPPSPKQGRSVPVDITSTLSNKLGERQGFGSGSGLDPYSIGPVDPDPCSESGTGSGSRRAKITHKSRKNSCFEVLDGLFCELQASSVTWTYFMEA
jgi:hypothetical protein